MDEFRIPETLPEDYEYTKKQFAAKTHILAIRECTAELFKLPGQEQLQACGITDYTALEYLHDTYNAARPDDERIGGRMMPVAKDGRRYAVVIIRSDYDPNLPQAEVIMKKFCILYHELGHAEDFYQGINFDHKKMQCRIRQAEAYADDFAVRHLKRIKCERIFDGKRHETTLGHWYRDERYRGMYVE